MGTKVQLMKLFFKWIKQQLRIKHLLGNSENAVQPHVWCTLTNNVLIGLVRKELQVRALMSACLPILSVYVFEKTER